MAPGFSASRLHAEANSISAKTKRLILVFIFTILQFLNGIVFYIKGSLTVTSWLWVYHCKRTNKSVCQVKYGAVPVKCVVFSRRVAASAAELAVRLPA